jgi:glycosyl transferase family 1
VLLITQSGINHASSRFRVHNWISYLERVGFECIVAEHYADSGNYVTYLPGPRLKSLARDIVGPASIRELIDSVDAVYCHEVLLPLSILQGMRKAEKRFVFDFSDPIDPTTSPSCTRTRRWLWRLFRRSRFKATLECAAFVIVENHHYVPLVHAHGSRSVVMRGPVNVQAFRPVRREPDHQIVIGWTGSPATESYLQPLLPVLEKLAASYSNLTFKTLGLQHPIDIPGLRVVSLPWTLETEPEHVGMFDIGISSVPDNDWTRMRGGGKLLVYCACGIPIVASPSGIGDQIIHEGINGFLPRNERQWYSDLERLITDPELRRRQGDENRRRAERYFSYQAYLTTMTALLDRHVCPESAPLTVESRNLVKEAPRVGKGS